jgi:predicted peptidase
VTRALFAALATALVFVAAGTAQDTKAKTGFVTKEFTDPDGSKVPYVVFVPHDYDGSKAYPVILFLHGAGESKSRGPKQPVEVGIGPAIKRQEKAFGFITVIPQSQKGGWQAGSAEGKRAVAILDEVTKGYKTDPARVYLTGLSMGGFGTWSLAGMYPERWAAIAPVCGGGKVESAPKMKDIPTWVFHGDKDTAVKVEMSRVMVDALKKAGGSPKYTEYPGVGHNSWDMAYAEKEFFPWLAAQKRK